MCTVLPLRGTLVESLTPHTSSRLRHHASPCHSQAEGSPRHGIMAAIRSACSSALRLECLELHTPVVTQLDDGILADLLDQSLIRCFRLPARRVADAIVGAG